MIHFVTSFVHQSGTHRAVSDQSLLDVMNLGYLELTNQVLKESIAFPRIRKTE